MVTTGRESVWDWEQVAPWVERRLKTLAPDVTFPASVEIEVEVHMERAEFLEEARAELKKRIAEIHSQLAHTRILAGADRVLAARDALRSEPDKTVREEFERLLEDA